MIRIDWFQEDVYGRAVNPETKDEVLVEQSIPDFPRFVYRLNGGPLAEAPPDEYEKLPGCLERVDIPPRPAQHGHPRSDAHGVGFPCHRRGQGVGHLGEIIQPHLHRRK